MQRVVPGGWCVMVYSPFSWTPARPSLDPPSVLRKNVHVRDTCARFLYSSFVFVRHVLFFAMFLIPWCFYEKNVV